MSRLVVTAVVDSRSKVDFASAIAASLVTKNYLETGELDSITKEVLQVCLVV